MNQRLPVIGLFVALLLALATLAAPGVEAQDAVQRAIQQETGRSVSGAEIVEGLRRSGLSREEVRQRLEGRGLDPDLADRYFDVIDGRSRTAPAPNDSFVAALAEMGMVSPASGEAELTAEVSDIVEAQDRSRTAGEGEGLSVFGKDVFGTPSTRFDPLRMGPVDPAYRLGPGDELRLILTGDVELAYTLDVTREGFIVIPDVGQVFVNGRTLSDLENTLFDRLGEVYSGVRRDADATTFFDISLGRLRANQVFLIGEVESPGAYSISSVASTFNALHGAGGPTTVGSFRNVFVRRGGQVVSQVDLYDYLLTGDVSDDIRLEHGDVVFVPQAGPQVRMTGEVRRPAIYELSPGEGLRDAIGFAGGITTEGDPKRVLIDRVLPPEERQGQVQRRIVSVDLETLPADSAVSLRTGDVVRVFPIRDIRRNRVTLLGQVLRPGDYELAAAMTTVDLIEDAGGLLPDAFPEVAHVSRLNEADSTRSLIRFSPGAPPDGAGSEVLPLQDQDIVTIFGRAALRVRGSVGVVGEVKQPGIFSYEEGMTAEDAVLIAGGFTESADGLRVEVVRPLPGSTRRDTIGLSFDVELEGRLPAGVSDVDAPVPGSDGAFTLQAGDRLFVRPLPGYVEVGTVQVTGEVQRPGSYGLTTREDRITSLIDRAGGVTDEAYIPGVRLIRGGVRVGLDLAGALRDPGGKDDLMVEEGDQVDVPSYDGTVLVTGAVRVDSRIPYDPGLGFGDYLDRAGGVDENGDRGRAYIEYANGRRDVSGRFLFFRNDPSVEPGSRIVIPMKGEDDEGFDVDRFLTRTLSIMGTVAGVIIAADRIGDSGGN